MLFNATFITLHEKWVDFEGAYAHGYLVILLVGSFIYLRLERYQNKNDLYGGNLYSIFFLLIGLFLWFLGKISLTQVFSQLALPIIFFALCASVFSKRAIYHIFLIPCLVLFFAVPVWDVLNFPLRYMTARVSDVVINGLGIPVIVNDFQFVFSVGIVQVAGGCSGINFFTAGLIMGIGYSEIVLNGRHRIKSVLIAALFAILSNWIRVIALMLIAYYSQMRHPLVYDHGQFGWIVFSVSLILYFIVMRKWISIPDENKNEHLETENQDQFFEEKKLTVGKILLPAIVVIGLIFTTKILIPHKHGQQEFYSLYQVPPDFVVNDANEKWAPNYSGYDVITQLQSSSKSDLELVILEYHEQRQGKELIYFSNRMFDEFSGKSLGVVKLEGSDILLKRDILREDNNISMVYWSYVVGEKYSLSAWKIKLNQVIAYFSGKNVSSLIAFKVDCGEKCQSFIDSNLEKKYLQIMAWAIEDIY